MPAISAGVLGEHPLDGVEVVERHDDDEVADRVRGCRCCRRTPIGRSAGPSSSALGQDRHLHRVVVAVVAALDLDDQVAAGDRAHQVDGVHRRLGAGVGEPPQRQPEAARQLLGDRRSRPRSAGRSGCPARTRVAHRLDDRRVGVAGDARRRSRRGSRRTRCRRRRRPSSPRRGSSRRPAARRSASSTWLRRRDAGAPARSARGCAAGGRGTVCCLVSDRGSSGRCRRSSALSWADLAASRLTDRSVYATVRIWATPRGLRRFDRSDSSCYATARRPRQALLRTSTVRGLA